ALCGVSSAGTALLSSPSASQKRGDFVFPALCPLILLRKHHGEVRDIYDLLHFCRSERKMLQCFRCRSLDVERRLAGYAGIECIHLGRDAEIDELESSGLVGPVLQDSEAALVEEGRNSL